MGEAEDRSAIRRGIAHAKSTGEIVFYPEAKRVEGDLYLALEDDPEAAIDCYEDAIAVARDMGTRRWELRAPTPD